MDKYEYRIKSFYSTQSPNIAIINEYGMASWELVSVVYEPSKADAAYGAYHLYFKRKIE